MFGGEKDPPQRVFWVGWIVPAILVLLVAVNLRFGRVYWLEKVRFIATYTDPLRFWGIVVLKLGVAVGTFAWHVLANDPRYERRAGPIALAGVVVGAGGFVAFLAGFFV